MIADHDVRYVRLKTNESKQTHTHTRTRNEIINLILTSQRKVTYSREHQSSKHYSCIARALTIDHEVDLDLDLEYGCRSSSAALRRQVALDTVALLSI